jgi:hypothetical protein
MHPAKWRRWHGRSKWVNATNVKIDSVLGGMTYTPPFDSGVSVADVIYRSLLFLEVINTFL